LEKENVYDECGFITGKTKKRRIEKTKTTKSRRKMVSIKEQYDYNAMLVLW